MIFYKKLGVIVKNLKKSTFQPKRIGIYIWELSYRYGGTESCAIKFCWALQQIYPNANVCFVSEVYDKNDLLSNEKFVSRLNDLSGLNLNFIKTSFMPIFCSKKTRLSRKLMYSKIQNSSKNFDLFFYCSRGNFYFKARKNIAIIHFPVLPIVQEKRKEGKFDISLFTRLKDKKYAKKYDLFLPNSKYTEKWLKKIRPDISKEKIVQLYHPVQPIVWIGEKKQNAILACSRFDKSKKLEVLIEAYKTSEYLNKNYELWLCGKRDVIDYDYPERLMKISEGFNVKFFINVTHEKLSDLYNQATFFWHSKGFGIDEDSQPDMLEHFGMSTVEAMSAGCIPIVINKGGQPEIVTENTGCCWNSIEELVAKTEEIAKDNEKLEIFSKNARNRASDFNMDKFLHELKLILLSRL